jgi:hypothetical protein
MYVLVLYALPQLPPQTILQQDEALPHFCHRIRNHLDREMDWQRWNNHLASSVARFDPTGFFIVGYVKNIVYQD